jgi:hypothetical protein
MLEEIADNDILYRRIPNVHLYEDGTVKSVAFQVRGKPDNSISVELARLDHLALTTTGKHLDSLQKAILRGTWNNQKYKEIAEEHNRSEKYVKEVGFKLWKLLSVGLGEEQVCKANFRAKLENLRVGNISLFGNGCIHIGNISADSSQSSKNLQPEPQYNDKFNEPTSNAKPKVCQDLSDAPEPNLFYNRTSELSTLENWILSRTRLITIYGLSGIGKTALTLQLIPQIQHEFDRIIWRSLRDAPPLASLQTDLIKFLSQQQETNPPQPPLIKGGRRDSTSFSPARRRDSTSFSPARRRHSTSFSPARRRDSTSFSPARRRDSTSFSPARRRDSTSFSPPEQGGVGGGNQLFTIAPLSHHPR